MNITQSINFRGEIPPAFCLMTACDSNYLHDHAKEYITSCALAQNNVHLHVVTATDADWAYMQLLRIGYRMLFPDGIMTLSSETTNLNGLTEEERRTYYACNRFIIASSFIQAPILITDIDCLIMKHITPFTSDIALFLRDSLPGVTGWEQQGTKVAAGAVYCTPKAKEFLSGATQIILNNNLQWFLDQVALNISYEQYKDRFSCTRIYNDFMDWEFVAGTFIWTGKGPRKYDNPTYVGMKKVFYNKFPNVSEEYWK